MTRHPGQPEAILRDSKKALQMYHDKKRLPDRFGDEVDNIAFWVRVVEIMRAELVKATKASKSPKSGS